MKTITLFMLMLLGSLAIAQQTVPDNYRLLWEISSPASAQPSYLFGTMHVTDSRVFGMPDSVLIAIQNSPGFALEIDFDAASYQMLEYMYAQHGGNIFDESHWARKAQSWDGEAPKADPADLFRLLNREDAHGTEATFLDAFLYRIARENGKTITGLEAIVDQLALLTDQDEETYPARDAQPDDQPRPSKRMRLSEMITVYSQGDIDRIDAMVNSGSTTKYFKEEVIIKRNHGMALRADSLMRIRPTFFGVGAAHLPGKEGVINLLREAGYTLRPVVATYSGLNKTYLEKPYQARWTDFKREGDGYQLQVPTRPFGMDILEGQIKMYIGMDFPGGLVYCFYAMNLPDEMAESKMDDVSKAMIKGFGSHGIDDDATKDIEYKTLKGKEYVVKKDGESLRIRVLFGNGKLFMLLLGNSEHVIFSDAAEHWFNSLEVFEPKRLTQQTPHPLSDPVNGFSLEFPGEPDYIAYNSESFTTGGENTPYNFYELKDLSNRQRMMMLTEDFEDWYSIGKLHGRMADCIRYYASADLDPEGEFKVLRTDGIPGLEGTYLGKSGLKYRIRCYLRMNRLYLLGMTLPEDDADSAVVDRVFESLRFLPVQQTKFTVAVKEPLQYEAMFPGKPNRIRRWTVPEALEGSVDSAWSNLYHDPATSLNTQITAAHVWKYYSGDDRSLLANAAKTTERDSAHIVRERSFEAEVWNAHELVLMSYDSTMLDHRQWVVSGDYLLEARVQTTNDAAGESTAKRFFEQFRSLALPLKVGSHKDAHLGPKLQLILAEDEDDTDSLFSDFGTFLNISRYKLRPEEYGMVLDSVRSDRDTMPYSTGEQLLSLLLDTNDSTLLPSLQSLYASLPATSPKRMTIVGSLLERDWEGASAWALARLHDDPSPLAYADLSFSWRDYLRDDSTHARLDSIAFLLDKPEFALDLAGTMAMWGTDADADYRAYIGSFQRILTAAIDGFDPKDDKIWQKAFHMDYMLLYLATNDVMGWRSLAHRMLMLDATYLPGSAFALLAESGDRMSKKEIQRVLQSRDSRQTALSWVLDNQRLDMLPAKYRDHSFIAAVALDVALEDYPAQVELVEKRKITYKDEPQWLYIYRFAFDGETDWTLGFSGPFPLNGDPESSYFDLAGSNWEEYHPNSYVKKTKAWVREMEEYAEE